MSEPATKNQDPSAKPDAAAPGKKVYVKTFGCQMNVYDSERMAELMSPHGYSETQDPADADLVILNTCHIREKAVEKVYSDLGRIRQLKEDRRQAGKDTTVAVAGCVAQAEGGEIARRAPVVDLVVGPQSYQTLPELIAKAKSGGRSIVETDFPDDDKFAKLPQVRRARTATAFLTVQEGCDKFCTFCVVPYTRGAEVSRNVDAIVAEARSLAAQGVREITLLGQNVNAWGATPPAGVSGDQWGLGDLCRHLAKIDGIERIRFTTSHPRDMDDGLIAAFAEEEKLMPYLHLPVQAGSDKILKAMNRGHTAEHYIKLIERIRAARPDIALSGDFIVGFPGETSEDFEATLALVETVGYASAYSFKYSRRPGTPGAAMAKQVAEDEKDGRLARLQSLLETQRQAFNQAQIGAELPVLFEKPGRHEGQLIGRSPYLQSVHVEAPQSCLGTIAKVKIEGVTPNALAGVLLKMEEAAA